MTKAIGWAVVAGGARIFIRSISDTRRAAIVNYLVVEHQVPVSSSWTDDDIEKAWGHYGKYVECRHVLINDDRLAVASLSPEENASE